jgi:hypothetical protein
MGLQPDQCLMTKINLSRWSITNDLFGIMVDKAVGSFKKNLQSLETGWNKILGLS